MADPKKCESCHRNAYYTTRCEACWLQDMLRFEKALHEITNQAHPQNPEIFETAMNALKLSDVMKQVQEEKPPAEPRRLMNDFEGLVLIPLALFILLALIIW